MIDYSYKHQIIDQPNNRSLHACPVPSGGGLAFVLTILLALPIIYFVFAGLPSGTISLVFLASLIASIGFIDDCRNLNASKRLALYAAVCAAVLYCLGGMPVISLFAWNPAWIMQIIGWMYLLWMVNLYNFMDGINGIAAFEAIFVCIGSVVVSLVTGHAELSYLPGIIAASTTGFLVWNFPLAKIFMGDAGSCYLGLILSGLSIQAAWVMPDLFWSWLILLGVFIVDSTYTLLCRALQGLKIHQAHNTHAYQHAASKFGHATVTISAILINVIWLLPLAVFVGLKYINPIPGIMLAYTPLLLIAAYFRAGIIE